MNPYKRLGCRKDATKEEVRRAYRRKAKKAHPDVGGKVEDFKRLAEAYALVSNPVRRKRFDETGRMDDPGTVKQQAVTELVSLLVGAVEQTDVRHVNVLERVRSAILSAIAKNKDVRAQREKCVLKLVDAANRATQKIGEDNMFRRVLLHQSEIAKAAVCEADRFVEVGEEMLRILEGYDWRTDGPAVHSTFGEWLQSAVKERSVHVG